MNDTQSAAPTRPVPSDQRVAFETALAERLEVDPSTTVMGSWRVDDSGGIVTLDHIIDGDELLAMFNTGRTEHRSLRTRLRSRIASLCPCDGAGCDEAYARRILVDLLDEPEVL